MSEKKSIEILRQEIIEDINSTEDVRSWKEILKKKINKRFGINE